MSWKLSACGWFSNFSRGHFLATTTSGTTASGQAVINVSDSSAIYYWQRGDIIKIGPSTNTNNLGNYEFVRVQSITGSSVTVSENLVYSYGASNDVTGIGHGLSQGMYIIHNGSVITPRGMNSKYSASAGVPLEGYLTGSAPWIKFEQGSILGLVIQKTSYYPLRGVKYRGGVYIHVPNIPTSGNMYVAFYQDGVSHGFNSINLGSSAVSTWTKFENIGTTATTANYDDPMYVSVFHGAVNQDVENIAFDCMYLTHALGCDTASEDAGVYTIPVNPIQVSEITTEYETTVRMLHNQSAQKGAMDNMIPRGFKLTFEDVTENMLSAFGVFEYWQSQGYWIMLETDDFTMRPCFGFVKIDQMFSGWDTSKIRVQLTFKGVQ